MILGEDDNLVEILKDMTSDRNKLNQDIGVSEGNITLLDKQITELSAELTDSDKVLNTCESIIKLGPQVAKLKDLTTTSNTITTITDTITTITNATIIEGRKQTTLNKIREEIEQAEELDSQLSIQLKSILARNENIAGLSKSLSAQQDAIQVQYGLASLESELNLLNNSRENITKIQKNISELSGLKFKKIDINEDAEKVQTLSTLFNQINSVRENISKLSRFIAEDEQKLSMLKEAKQYFDVCPYCNQPLQNHTTQNEGGVM